MSRPLFGAKPSVLRCSRCGRFVDWEQARLQLVCSCRPQLELPPVLVRAAEDGDRARVERLLMSDFGHLTIVAFGEVMHAHEEAALVAEMKDDLAGVLAYRLLDGALHVVALATDPLWQRSGVGAHLLAEAELLARAQGRSRLIAATSNDNIPALYFYQRHGFRLIGVARDAFAAHLKTPGAAGFAGIPVHDEVQMEKRLP